jgi:hypothetical protein
LENNYILMVFEGEVTEKDIVNNLREYYLNTQPDTIVYGFHCGEIYSLYNKLNNDRDLELFPLLKENLQHKNIELKDIERNQVSEIYLFFDYDGHSSSANYSTLKCMLELFDNETGDYGKLYISYPMVEAIKHLKTNIDFRNITVESSKSYKQLVSSNSDNKFQDLNNLTEEHWNFIINQHSKKANFIVNDNFEFPSKIIEQIEILENQKVKYINIDNKVAVLSSFPLFLLDYYGINYFKD